MISFAKTCQNNIPANVVQPRRSQVYLGFTCNQQCGFCYYKTQCLQPFFDDSKIYRQIDLLLKYGIIDFEITGGEPGLCNKLSTYCKYIKEKSPVSKIAVITNGELHRQTDAFEYIDEVLVSYHTSRYVEPDKAIFPKGDTYDKVLATVNLAKQHKLLVRTNTVVGIFNIEYLDKIILEICTTLKPDIINFLPLNIFDEAANMSVHIDYTECFQNNLDKSIKCINKLLPNTLIFIRYVPYCILDNYKQYIVGYIQHIYDWFDWNVEMSGMNLLEKFHMSDEQILNMYGKYGSTSFESAFKSMNTFYIKPNKCMRCKYYLICEGIEKNNNNLLNQIHPISGQLIKNPLEFIKTTSHDFYRKWYNIQPV